MVTWLSQALARPGGHAAPGPAATAKTLHWRPSLPLASRSPQTVPQQTSPGRLLPACPTDAAWMNSEPPPPHLLTLCVSWT